MIIRISARLAKHLAVRLLFLLLDLRNLLLDAIHRLRDEKTKEGIGGEKRLVKLLLPPARPEQRKEHNNRATSPW